MRNYISEILKAVQCVPIKDSYISDYVAMRIYNLLGQDCFLNNYFARNEVDIPDFMKREFNMN